MFVIRVGNFYYQDKNKTNSEFGGLKTAFIFDSKKKAIKKSKWWRNDKPQIMEV